MSFSFSVDSAAARDRRRRILRSVGVAVAAALLLAIAGAFETGKEPFPERLVYWLIVMGAGSLWGQSWNRVLERSPFLDERPWLHVLLLTVIIAVPMCFFVWGTTGLFFFDTLLPLSSLWPLVVPVLSVSAAVCAVIVFLGRAMPVQTHSSADASKPPKFIDRMPLRLRAAKLIAVQAEDHYLRVHTTEGSDLILMRLSDAIGELEGLEGAQTHRSWWVAKDAVRRATRRDGRATLELEGGLVAPVSRRYARSLRDAGWF